MKHLYIILLALLFTGSAFAQSTGNTEYIIRSEYVFGIDNSRQAGIKALGFNPDVGASEEDVWGVGGGYTGWLQADSTVRIQSGGNSNDDDGGSGCQQVTVEGLDANWDYQSVNITTNGTGASTATSETFIRVNRAWCSLVGSYTGLPTGDITLETTGGTVLADIDSLTGQTEMLIYSVPRNHVLVVETIEMNVNSSNAADIIWWRRDNANDVTTPFASKRIWHRLDDHTGEAALDLKGHQVFDEYTDIWVGATRTSGSAAQVAATMVGTLYRK